MSEEMFGVSDEDRLFGYIWSEKSNENESKFGQNYVEANKKPISESKKRIRESLGVRKDKFDNDEIIIHGIIDLTEYAKKHNMFSKKAKVDDHIRKQIGFVKQGEVHLLSGDVLLKKIYNLLDKSETKFRPTYKPRFYQEYIKEIFLDKINTANKGKNDIGLELAPRFGKTLWSIDLIQTLFQDCGYKICFLPAYVLTSSSSFGKTFDEFDGYSTNMILVETIDELNDSISNYYGKKMIIVIVSLHMNNYINKLKKVLELQSYEKVSFVDEADFGAHRLNSQSLIKYLDCDLNIYMTGTAIERAVSPLENLLDIIRFSYIDMLMVQKGEHPIQKYFV